MISPNTLHQGDCLELLNAMEDGSVDLVFGSPPYGNQRTYESNAKLFEDDAEWLQWALARFEECLRVSRGIVAWVVEGYTVRGTFHPLPEMLTVALMEAGYNVRHRAIYQRHGIPGGSPDELAQHHEMIVMASWTDGRLPYADPKATGLPPKCKPGGKPSMRKKNGDRQTGQEYKQPSVCKASNVINCGAVGGGNMGSPIATENEAPFCEIVADTIVRTYCPVNGIVLDPFCGGGTTLAVAVKSGRDYIGMDLRQSQMSLSRRRINEAEIYYMLEG